MGRLPAWAARFEAHFASALREEGLLACSDGSEKSVCDCYALRSLGLAADAAGGDPALAGRQRVQLGRQVLRAPARVRTRARQLFPRQRYILRLLGRAQLLQRDQPAQDLHAARGGVVLLTEDERAEHARRRVERVDGGVDAKLGNLAGQNRCRI